MTTNLCDHENNLFSDESPESISATNYAKVEKIYNDLSNALINEMHNEDYIHPSTENFSISGYFTQKPDFDVLQKLFETIAKDGKKDFYRNFTGDQLRQLVKSELNQYSNGGRYYISFMFGTLPPILALLPFLAVYSKITDINLLFLSDKWEVRGDYHIDNHVGIKLINHKIMVGKFINDSDFVGHEVYAQPNSYLDYEYLYPNDEWMNQYGIYVSKNPNIDFNGKFFVFTGVADSESDLEELMQKVTEKGGYYRANVSGLTNYLVIGDAPGSYKMKCVLKQLAKGKNIQVVHINDLIKALKE